MNAKGLATRKGMPVKVLAKGELSKALTVHAHAFRRPRASGSSGRRHLRAASRASRRGRRGLSPMISTILGAFRVKEIRNKVLFTALLLALYRLGTHIPAPGINSAAVKAIQQNFGGNSILGLLNLFSGGGLSRIAIFALGIMPYITASIILQLLQVVVPSLEKLAEGGRGRAGADHAVHAVPDGRARVRAVDRLRVPVQELREAGRRSAADHELHAR